MSSMHNHFSFDIPYGYDQVRPSESIPPRLYHVAPASKRQDISDNGLDASGNTWNTGGQEDLSDWNQETQMLTDGEWRPEGVYMFLSVNDARQYADPFSDERQITLPEFQKVIPPIGDIWEIHTALITTPIIRDPSIAHYWEDAINSGWGAYVTSYVPPNALRLVNPEEHLASQITGPEYSRDRALRYMDNIRPNEQFNVGGDCLNPKCDYKFTAQDITDIERDGGWFTCPKCQMSYNLYDGVYNNSPGGWTRAGLTMTQMGRIGEQTIQRMGSLPNVGQVMHYYGETLYNNPIDFIIGPYGCEVKTIHSEAQQRFKVSAGRGAAVSVERRVQFCNDNNLIPALVGVRLNFYTDLADVFFRQGFVDTWIGNSRMSYEGEVNFADINPFKHPEDVPPPDELPSDDFPF